MRPAQQNRRMRGRGNNNNNGNRKGPNPLSRNYESNGPDVKIRGNAQHIAEKYTTLARDAQASGDRVMAENYLQHAEHYNRIILAAQAHLAPVVNRDDQFDDENEDDETSHVGTVRSVSAPVEIEGSGPQPFIDGTPAEVVFGEENSENSHSDNRPRNQGRDQRRMQRPRRPRFEAHSDEAAAPTGRVTESAEFDARDTSAVSPRDTTPVQQDDSAYAVNDGSDEKSAPRRARTTRPRSAVSEVAKVEDNANDDGDAPARKRITRPRRVKSAEDEQPLSVETSDV